MNRVFGSAWELDPRTGQYHYHAFLRCQPDLDWRNHEVREAMFETARFWLDRGVDGFLLDLVNHLVEDDRLRDNPCRNPAGIPGVQQLVPYEWQEHDFSTGPGAPRPTRSCGNCLSRHFSRSLPAAPPTNHRKGTEEYPERVLVGGRRPPSTFIREAALDVAYFRTDASAGLYETL